MASCGLFLASCRNPSIVLVGFAAVRQVALSDNDAQVLGGELNPNLYQNILVREKVLVAKHTAYIKSSLCDVYCFRAFVTISSFSFCLD